MKFYYIAFLLALISASGAAQVIKQEIFRTSDNEILYDFIKTTDNGYLFTGNIGEIWSGNADAFILKTSETGQIEWGKTYGGNADDAGLKIRETAQGNYFMAGQTFSFNNSEGALYALMIDENGDVIWSKALNYDAWTFVYDVSEQLENGDFLIAGSKNSPWVYGKEMFLCRIDSDGNFIWFKTFNASSNNDWAYDVNVLENGDILLCGRFNYTSDSGFAGILKLNPEGNVIWAKIYNDYGFGLIHQTIVDEEGNIYAVGRVDPDGYGIYKNLLIKTNANGNPLWAKTYSGTGFDFGRNIQMVPSGALLIAGNTDSFGLGDRDLFLLKVNGEGDFLWGKTYGGLDTDTHHGMTGLIVNEDQSIVLRGCSKSFSNGTSDIYLVYTDSEGNSGCNQTAFEPEVTDFNVNVTAAYITLESYSTGHTPTQVNAINFEYELLCSDTLTTGTNQTLAEKHDLKLLPNPAGHFLTVETNQSLYLSVYIITTLTGEIVLKGKLAANDFKINTGSLTSGIYFIEIYDCKNQLIGSEKLMIQ